MKRRAAASGFFRRVLSVVKRIPPGRVATYGDVARLAGRPGAARAVGNILREAHEAGVPYHRVIAAGGRVGGYGGQPGLKPSLLMAEGHRLRGHRIVGFAVRRWPSPGNPPRPAGR
jgi:O-6-methylguanine DNA methyltransferase